MPPSPPAVEPRARVRDRLGAFDPPGWADWVVPLAAAASWSVALAATSGAGLATVRGMVFVGGPIVLLAGLHARLTGYLHAPARLLLLPLPLPPREHFVAARRRHLRGLVTTGLSGSGALLLGLVTVGAPPGGATLGLVVDWLWLLVLAGLTEPAIAGASAWLGRRFEAGTWPHQLQRSLGGGWTLPEATVHLYAPAVGLGLAAALAMPGQLLVDRLVDGLRVPSGLAAAAAIGLAAGVVLFVTAPLLYARGMFEAIPWLSEVTRTLAGPPVPEPAPRWVRRISDPVLRLLVLQFLRQTPVPVLRLLVLTGTLVWVALVDTLTPTLVAVVAGAGLLWIVPARKIAQARPARARLLAPLPLPTRTGRHRGALALVWSPVVAPWLVLAARHGGVW